MKRDHVRCNGWLRAAANLHLGDNNQSATRLVCEYALSMNMRYAGMNQSECRTFIRGLTGQVGIPSVLKC